MVSLTREEENIFTGEYGRGLQRGMEILVKVADAHGAERMIEISGAHLIAWEGARIGVWSETLMKLLSELTEGATVRVPTTVNALLLNVKEAKMLGIRELLKRFEFLPKMKAIFKRIGAIPSYTCHGQFLFEPKRGDHYALTESGVAMFANAWFGIMSNLEGGPTALASALTGKTPEYGLQIPENRLGRVLVKIKDLNVRDLTYADYGVISYYTGRTLANRIPVYSGLPSHMTAAQVKYMCIPQIWRSASVMFHILKVTPEAPSLEAAFGGEKPDEKITIGKQELHHTYEELSAADSKNVDTVVFGCPHCTLSELKEIGLLLQGKRIHNSVRLWAATNEPFRVLADRMGYVNMIERAGGFVLSDSCALDSVLIEHLGIETIATNSANIAAIPAWKGKVWLGNVRECVKASISGRWEAR